MNTNQPRMSHTDPCSSSPWCRNPGHTATSRSSEQELWSAQPSHLPCSHPSGAGTATGKVQTLPSRGRNISLPFAELVFLMKMLLVKSRTSAGITAACRRRWENPLEVGKPTGVQLWVVDVLAHPGQLWGSHRRCPVTESRSTAAAPPLPSFPIPGK